MGLAIDGCSTVSLLLGPGSVVGRASAAADNWRRTAGHGPMDWADRPPLHKPYWLRKRDGLMEGAVEG